MRDLILTACEIVGVAAVAAGVYILLGLGPTLLLGGLVTLAVCAIAELPKKTTQKQER